MAKDIAQRLTAINSERPNLSLLGRTGQRTTLASAHADRLYDIIKADPSGGNYVPGPLIHINTDGIATTVDQGAGTWSITAHRNANDQWLSISEISGLELAQRNTDLDDIDDVALSMTALWNWATVGPEVY